MTDRHTGWNSVRVDNHVWYNTFDCKRKILLSIGHSTSTFLTVTTSEFVTDLGYFDSPHLNFHESFVLIVCRQDDLFNISFFRVLQGLRLIFKWLLLACLIWFDAFTSIIVLEDIVGCRGDCFADNNVVAGDLIGWTDNSIGIELVISAMLETTCLLGVRNTDPILVTLCHRIGSIEHRSEEASVDS
jgi:hypothetical protein